MKGQELAQRSRSYITAALLDLMKKYPYEKITVTDITDRAGVARLTFYRNFSDKDDVLRTHLQGTFSHYMGELKSGNSLVDALTVCFSYWKSNGEFTKLLIKNRIEHILFQPFNEYVGVVLTYYKLSDRLTTVQKEFIAGGLFFSMMDWIMDDHGLAPRQSAEQVLALLRLPSDDSRCSFP